MKQFGSAIILAGGKSKRMGFDKQFLEIRGQKIVEIIAVKLADIFDDIMIVTNKPQFYTSSKWKILSDEMPGKGPLSGIHVGLKHAVTHYVYVMACDMPMVSLSHIEKMRASIESDFSDACICKTNKRIEPFHAFYSKDTLDRIEKHLEGKDFSMRSFFRGLKCIYLNISKKNEDMFINLNTKEELEEFAIKQ